MEKFQMVKLERIVIGCRSFARKISLGCGRVTELKCRRMLRESSDWKIFRNQSYK